MIGKLKIDFSREENIVAKDKTLLTDIPLFPKVFFVFCINNNKKNHDLNFISVVCKCSQFCMQKRKHQTYKPTHL